MSGDTIGILKSFSSNECEDTLLSDIGVQDARSYRTIFAGNISYMMDQYRPIAELTHTCLTHYKNYSKDWWTLGIVQDLSQTKHSLIRLDSDVNITPVPTMVRVGDLCIDVHPSINVSEFACRVSAIVDTPMSELIARMSMYSDVILYIWYACRCSMVG